ncbi:MAG TPA: protein kinase [Polyangiaceae bacterium]|nr:protein kinase [Polyangiaceae bacterium]
MTGAPRESRPEKAPSGAPTLLSPAAGGAAPPEQIQSEILGAPVELENKADPALGLAATWEARSTARAVEDSVVSAVGFSGAPRRGDRIGENQRFEIVEKLGEGGMGHVFRAIDSHLGRTVAVKFILETQNLPLEQLITQLKREARATAQLNHENIVAIFDMGAFNGVPFLVMELLDGQSLDVIMDASRILPVRATAIMLQVALGLSHAHENGIVHRDLKPSNVFILRDGRVKILDFGISRFERPLAPSLPDELSPTSYGAGTPAYMAPERWREGPQDGRADIWAAGVMFYQMLTGKLPYTVPELRSFAAPTRRVAPSVRAVLPMLPEQAERIIATALNHEPEGRYQTPAELLEALRELERELLLGNSLAGLGRTGGAPRVERRPLTLLECHFDGLVELDLDDVIEAQLRLYETCAAAVELWGGLLGAPVGGRLLGCFGYPSARETDAEHAVRAGQEIVHALRELFSELSPGPRQPHVRIAIHSGILGLPNLAAGASAFPAMVGTVPNVLRKMMEKAEPMKLIISQATLELTGNHFIVESTSPAASEPPGLDRADRVYRVLGEGEALSRFEQAQATRLTPLEGREREMAFFRELWQSAKDGRGQLVILSGDAGIGKSRIVHALRDRVTEERNTRLTSQCRPQFRNTAFRPLVELVLRSMHIARGDSVQVKLEKLEGQLNKLGFPADSLAIFAPLLAIPCEERHPSLELTPEKRKAKSIEALIALLLRGVAERPVLFIVEDVHWVDHSTIEFLNSLIGLLPTSRLLVVLTCRPEFRSPWSPRRHLHQISLDRLPPAATEAMIRRAARSRTLPDELVTHLATVADGVPLFVEELTRMVVESWQGRLDNLTQRRIEIPNTLHELLLARLDRLRGLGKDLAQVCAVLGRDFNHSLIRALSELDEMGLQRGLDLLTAAGLLHRHGQAPDFKYQFKHALIQQAAYQSLLKSERRLHHARTADALTRVFPDTVTLEPELLAYHHAEAGNMQEALSYWETAGQQATQRSGLIEAIDHYKNALSALHALEPSSERDKHELGLLLALGAPLMSVHGYAAPDVEKTYARARELARAGGTQGNLFPAMQGLWQYYYVRGMLPASRALGEQLLEIARESQDSTLLLLAHRSVASSAFLQGDFEPCRVHTAEGMRLYDVQTHGALALKTGHDPGVAHGVYQAWTLWMLGYPDQALRCVLDMVELARRLSHPLTMAYALCFAALIRNHRAEHTEALELSQAALRITEPNKFALWNAWATMQLGWALAGSGQLELGIPHMTRGLDGWKSTGARVGFTFFPVTLAEMCLRAGQLSQAEQLLAEAGPMIEENDEHFYEPELLRLRAELLRQQGVTPLSAILRQIEDGLAIASARRGKSWELRLTMMRTQLRLDVGDYTLRLRELREVFDWFSEGHETGDLRAARALLDAPVLDQ